MSVSVWTTPPTPAASTIVEADRGHGPFRSPAGIGVEGCFVGITDDRCTLGVLAPDRSRNVVVVTTDGELAVAVRDTVPPGSAEVRDARPDDFADIAAACLPWPWMVVGCGAGPVPALSALLRYRPVLALWLGEPPADLAAARVRTFDRPAGLLGAVTAACTARVGEMRLAPGCGIELADGTVVRGGALEALVGAHPQPVPLSSRLLRSVSATLARHDVRWTARRSGAAVVLVPITSPGWSRA